MAMKKFSLKSSSATGTARPAYVNRVLPKEKRAKEVFIVEQFASIQSVVGCTLTDIRTNADDSEGKADVLARVNGNEIGIQVTELKIAHRAASADRAWKMTETLLDIILARVKPDNRIFVDIWSRLDYSNKNLKLVGKRLELLGKAIAKGIRDSIFSPSPSYYFDKSKFGLKPNPLAIPAILQGAVRRVELHKIPEGHNTICHGRKNVFINFNFDTVVNSDELEEALISRLIARKADSKAGTLLIWACDQDFWGEEERIHKLFLAESQETCFDNIYLFFFMDVEPLFEANKKVFIMREKS